MNCKHCEIGYCGECSGKRQTPEIEKLLQTLSLRSDAESFMLSKYIRQLQQENEDWKNVNEDKKALVRELDYAMNGENAAKQASLCDLIHPVEKLVAENAKFKTALEYYVETCGHDKYSEHCWCEAARDALGIQLPTRQTL